MAQNQPSIDLSDIPDNPSTPEVDLSDIPDAEEPGWFESIAKMVLEPPKMLVDKAKEFADSMSQPSLGDVDKSFPVNFMGANIPVSLPHLKGFLGGTAEGVASQLSPLNIAATAMPGGKVARTLSGVQALEGARQISKGNYLRGAGNIGMGALGMLPRPSASTAISKADDVVPEVLPAPDTPEQLKLPDITMPAVIDANDAPAGPVDKLVEMLRGAPKLTAKQADIYSLERGQRIAKAEGIPVNSEADLAKYFAQLKGAHTKVQFDPLRAKLEQPDIDELVKTISISPEVRGFERTTAFDGLNKLLGGQVPQDSELRILSKVFGRDMIDITAKFRNRPRRLAVETASAAKAFKSAGDFGAPFRQGINYAGRRAWLDSWMPMFKSYFNANKYVGIMKEIESKPNYDFKIQSGLEFTGTHALAGKEEAVQSAWAQNVPGLGALVKSSDRAQTAFMNTLRDGVFDTISKDYRRLYESVKKTATTAEELKEAELLNPDTLYRGKIIADMVNTATGRGKLPGNLNAIQPELNALLFAPKLMSSRIRTFNRILNPYKYWTYNSIERKEALKQLLSISGVIAATSGIYKTAGFDIGTDPTSADFLKAHDGSSRLDPGGGYLQYIVPAMKLLQNQTTSTTSDTTRELGSFDGQSAPGVIGSTIESKLSPVAAFARDIISRKEFGNKPLNFTSINPAENTLTKDLVTPLIIQDIYELIQEDPDLIPWLAPPAMAGMGVQTYRR